MLWRVTIHISAAGRISSVKDEVLQAALSRASKKSQALDRKAESDVRALLALSRGVLIKALYCEHFQGPQSAVCGASCNTKD